MADLIEIEISSLDTDIRSMEGDLASLRKELGEAYAAVQELDTMWNGPANDAFNREFEKDHANMEGMCDTIQKIIDYMVNASKEYRQCEASVSAEIDAIKI